MNPPSPCTGSSTAHATVSGSTSPLKSRFSAARAWSSEMPRNGYGAGARYTSGANGPKPRLYGTTLAVIVIARSVRPWNALSNTTTAGRPVAARAILTAFSTASAPVLSSTVFCGAPRHGDSSPSRRHTSTYGSYIPTMKHWCRYSSACRWIAATTAPGEWPRLAQPSPPAKSTYSRPSASQIRAPSARATTSGGVEIPRATQRSRPSWTRSVALRSCNDTVERLYTPQPNVNSRSNLGDQSRCRTVVAFEAARPPRANQRHLFRVAV